MATAPCCSCSKEELLRAARVSMLSLLRAAILGLLLFFTGVPSVTASDGSLTFYSDLACRSFTKQDSFDLGCYPATDGSSVSFDSCDDSGWRFQSFSTSNCAGVARGSTSGQLGDCFASSSQSFRVTSCPFTESFYVQHKQAFINGYIIGGSLIFVVGIAIGIICYFREYYRHQALASVAALPDVRVHIADCP